MLRTSLGRYERRPTEAISTCELAVALVAFVHDDRRVLTFHTWYYILGHVGQRSGRFQFCGPQLKPFLVWIEARAVANVEKVTRYIGALKSGRARKPVAQSPFDARGLGTGESPA